MTRPPRLPPPARLLLGLASALALAGCQPDRPADSSGIERAAADSARWEPLAPNPPLRTVALRVGSQAVTAEVALDPKEQATGLMFRDHLPAEAGMLFVFPTARPVAFYMKNTRIPLTVAYIDRQGIIQELHDLEPFVERPVDSRSPEIRFVLEMNRGWFASKGIGPGVRVTTGGRPLAEIFP